MKHTDLLSGFRRITIKIGSSLLVDGDKSLRRSWLDGLAADIAGLRSRGSEVLVVSSGAIALGRAVMGLPKRALKLEESQAAAAVGQIALAHAWSGALASHDLVAGQILITLHDTETRRRYLNARATMATLLGLGAVPVINENDTVATHEIRYGDNDRLAARVSTMAGADLLILLSDVDGLYTAPPAGNAEARFIDRVEALTPEIEAMAGAAGSELSRGGMRTKIDAARIATQAGCAMVIASGKRDHPVAAIAAGEKATWFDTHMPVANARKTWIAGYLEPDGRLHVDDGALRALESGKSLLAAGVARVEGDFERGDTVAIVDASGRERGRGLAAYGAGEAQAIAGRQSSQILETLGYAGRGAMIHRDDLVLTAGNPRGTEEAGENNDAHDA